MIAALFVPVTVAAGLLLALGYIIGRAERRPKRSPYHGMTAAEARMILARCRANNELERGKI